MLSCFTDVLSARRTTGRTVTKASTQLRLEEVQALLQKWYELTISYYKANPACPVTRCNLVLYHLISLNAVTNFPEIERLARREGLDGSYWELSLAAPQALHLPAGGSHLPLRPGLPAPSPDAQRSSTQLVGRGYVPRYPHHLDGQHLSDGPQLPDRQAREPRTGSTNPVAIDQVTPEDPAVIAYLWSGDGVAVLTRMDGSTVNLDKPSDVLSYSIKTIEEGFSQRIGDGIRRKLISLGNNWNVDGMGTATA